MQDRQDDAVNVAVMRGGKVVLSKWLQLPDEDLNDEGFLFMLNELFGEIKDKVCDESS